MKNKINFCIQNNSIVKIYYFKEEFYGYILMNSKNFLLIREMFDFQYRGFIIFNKQYIKKIKISKQEIFYKHLMSTYTNIPYFDYKWIKLKSIKKLLKSLYDNYNEICLETVKKKNIFLVGKIIKFDNKYVYIRSLDTMANYDQNIDKLKLKHIGKIVFADSYSKLLFKYNEDFIEKNEYDK